MNVRETMFRGRRREYSEWIYGYLIGDDVIVGNIVEFNDEYFNTAFWYKVRPETVGQYTGLKDKNGKEIYEGDIVLIPYNRLGTITVKMVDGAYNISRYRWELCEVIGNVFEDGELLNDRKRT